MNVLITGTAAIAGWPETILLIAAIIGGWAAWILLATWVVVVTRMTRRQKGRHRPGTVDQRMQENIRIIAHRAE